MNIFTIGFTQKSAEAFFKSLRSAGVRRVVDVRLNNSSQLAGFSKMDDLKFFLREIGGIEYVHLPQLAPTQDILDAYKKQKGDWDTYAKNFLGLMEARKIESTVAPEVLDHGCLLCSEHKPHHCHRRLVADYLRGKWGEFEVKHL